MVNDAGNLSRLCQLLQHEHANDREPRRSVALEGYGILDDGTTFGLSLLDLSYDGCKVETELALLPGLKMKMSIAGIRGVLEASVRWCKESRAGLEFTPGEASQTSRAPRRHERTKTAGELIVRRAGRQHYHTQIFDLTPTGCRIEFVERPRPGELLWIRFPGFDSIEATVRWIDGFYGGLEFERPIYPAVFEIILARLRA